MSMQEDLQDLGLSKEESIVYDALVSFGARTIGQISVYTGLPLESIESALDSLNRKGYAKHVEGKNKENRVYIPLSPKIVVSSDVARKLNEDLTAIQEQINNDWTKAQKLLETHSQSLVENTQKEITGHITSIDEFTNDRVSALDSWVKNSQESITQTIENHVRNINETITGQINDLLAVIEKNVSDIGDESNQARNNILTDYEVFNKGLRETLENIKENSTLILNKAHEHLSHHIASVNSEQEQALKALAKTLDRQKKLLVTALGEAKDSMLKDIDKTGKTLGKDIEKTVVKEVSTFITRVQEFLTWFREQQKTIMDSATKAEEQSEQIIQEQFDIVKAEFSKLITDLANEFDKQTVKAKEIAVTQLGTSIQGVQEHLKKSEEEITSALNEFLTEFTEQLSTLQETLNQTLTKQHASLVSASESYRDSLEKTVDEFSTSISTTVTELKDFLITFMNEFREDARNNLLAHKEQVNTLFEESMSQASGKAKELMDTLASEYTELLSGVQNTLEDKRAHVKEEVSTTHASIHQELATLEGKTTDHVKETMTNFDEDYTDVLNLLDKELQETKARIEEIKTEASNAVEGLEKNVGSRLKGMETEVFSAYASHLQDSVENFERRMINAKETHERALTEFFEDFLDLTSRLRDTIPRTTENMFSEHSDRFSNFQQNYSRTISHLISAINEFVATAEQNKGWMKKKENQAMIEKIKNLRDNITRDTNEANTMIAEFISEMNEAKEEALTSITRVFTEEIDNAEEEQLRTVRRVGEKLDAIVKAQKEAVEGLKQSLKSELEGSTDEYLRSLKDDLSAYFTTKLQELLGKAETAAMAIRPGETESKFKQVLTSYADILHNTSQEFIATLSTNLQDATGKLEQNKDALLSLSDAAYDIATNAVQEGSENSKKALTNIVNETMNVFDRARTDLGDSLETIVSETDEKIQNLISQKQEEIQEKVSTDLNSVVQRTEHAKKDVKDTVETLIQASKAFTDETMSQSTQHIEKSMNEQKTLITTTNSSLEKMIQTSFDFLEERKNMLATEVGEALEETLHKVKQLPETSNKEFERLTSEAKGKAKQAREPLSMIVTTISESGKDFDEEVQKLENHKASLGKTLNETATSMMNASKENVKKTSISYEKTVNDAISTFTTEHKKSLTGLMKTSKASGETELQKAQNEAEVLLTTIKKELEDTFYKAETSVKKEIDFIENSIEKEANQVRNQHDKASTAIKAGTTTQGNTIKGAFQSLGKTLNDIIQSQTEKDKEKIMELDQTYKEHLTGFSNDFKEKLFSDLEASTNELSTAIESIPNAITQALDETGKALEFFKRLSQTLKGTDPLSIELTYLDAGKETIVNILNAMIRESKRSFTVVSSAIDWMDKELLQSLSMSKQLNVITDPEKHTNKDKEVLSFLKTINANVTLRRFSEDQDPILLADRDSESILIGLPLREKTPYAVITLDERLVRMLQQIITPLRNKPRLT